MLCVPRPTRKPETVTAAEVIHGTLLAFQYDESKGLDGATIVKALESAGWTVKRRRA